MKKFTNLTKSNNIALIIILLCSLSYGKNISVLSLDFSLKNHSEIKNKIYNSISDIHLSCLRDHCFMTENSFSKCIPNIVAKFLNTEFASFYSTQDVFGANRITVKMVGKNSIEISNYAAGDSAAFLYFLKLNLNCNDNGSVCTDVQSADGSITDKVYGDVTKLSLFTSSDTHEKSEFKVERCSDYSISTKKSLIEKIKLAISVLTD